MRRTAEARINESVRIERGNRHSIGLETERIKVRQNLLRTQPRIDSKYFYDDVGSELFEEITHLPEYYQTRTEEALLATIADDVVTSTGAHELVELGSGAGRKIRLLLDAMRSQGRLESCVLLDINETFLRASAEELADQYPEMEICGVVGDFLHDLELVGSGDNRLFIFLAGTIGNLYPAPAWHLSRRTSARPLDRSDGFLVGLDLVKDTARLEAAYNDSAGVTAEFNLNALRVLNRRFGTDFEVDAFEHVAFYDLRTSGSRCVSARKNRPAFRWATRPRAPLRTGDEIRTEISRKFTRRVLCPLRSPAPVSSLSEWFTDPEGLFASALVRPVGPKVGSMTGSIRERLRACWSRSDEIFDLLEPEALHEQPIGLRHPSDLLPRSPAGVRLEPGLPGGARIFHPSGPNSIRSSSAGSTRWGSTSYESSTDWPPVDEIIEYRDRVRQALLDSRSSRWPTLAIAIRSPTGAGSSRSPSSTS